jgi:hypothetical protein
MANIAYDLSKLLQGQQVGALHQILTEQNFKNNFIDIIFVVICTYIYMVDVLKYFNAPPT